MKQVIHIFGASGAGTSTLGKKICEELGFFFMDTDDYFWEPTDPKYTVKRSFEERLRLMKEDIEKHDQIVMDGAGDLDANFQCVKRELDRKGSAPVMPYYRVHTSDIAYMTQQPRGIFTAVWKLVENKTLTEEEEKEYWKNREYFEEVLPVPPFYEQGNPDNATTWFKNAEAGNDIWKQMTFYRDMCKKYGVRLYLTECEELPGELVYEDAFQIGIKNTRPDLTVVTQVLE